jgi:hypothetical protein
LLNLLLALFKIAMPHLFHWKEAMGFAEGFMWSTLYTENFGISLLLLFFAYASIFHWRALLEISLGKTVLLFLGSLWVFRTVAEVFQDRRRCRLVACDHVPWRCTDVYAAAC